jgi:hypothetical protein
MNKENQNEVKKFLSSHKVLERIESAVWRETSFIIKRKKT